MLKFLTLLIFTEITFSSIAPLYERQRGRDIGKHSGTDRHTEGRRERSESNRVSLTLYQSFTLVLPTMCESGLSQGLRRAIVSVGTIMAPLWGSSASTKPSLLMGVLVALQGLSLVRGFCNGEDLILSLTSKICLLHQII